jgi:alpha-L-rhamnosidase
MRPVELSCEYRANPQGIDTTEPRLAWILEPTSPNARGLAQSAYQILVAESKEALGRDAGDLWDSGRVATNQSAQITYAGRPLGSHQACWWKVRVWDAQGQASGWSAPAYWSMGLLHAADWKAQWIGLNSGLESSAPQTGTDAAHWIWFPEGNPAASAPLGTRFFRRELQFPAGRFIKKAVAFFTADNDFTFFANGVKTGTGNTFQQLIRMDITEQLHAGANVLTVTAGNVGASPNPAGLLGAVRIEFASGEPMMLVTDGSWQTSLNEKDWQNAMDLGANGMGPWNKIAWVDESRRLPARLLRHEFEAQNRIHRATAYMSGLGLSELYINGKKVSDDVLSPGLTEYNKRAFYVTHDVTSFVKSGKNAIGVMLGNGRYFAPRLTQPMTTGSYGYPKLLLHLRIENQDGTVQEVVSDETWKLTTEGPIRANNEYDGEEYDARRELPGWATTGFDDGSWQTAQMVEGPAGASMSQSIEPIRVMETLKPKAITEPKPGVFIFDMGQNMVGWCRLTVRGPAGTTISLRHAETLRDDGTLYLDNIRAAKVTDLYTLKGKGTEVYEPRFTYHGFRYVEVKGFPGKPKLSSIEGKVVHDSIDSVGQFTSSNELLNRIYKNVRWGVRGNYRSIPTDCPQRDERQGWLGDRSAESRGEGYMFNTAALYSKWLRDMADAQQPNGSIPDVAPSYWPIYSDNVTWPSSAVIIPDALYDQYGDLRLIQTHYPAMKQWITHMSGYITNNLMPRDTYGDWCVPPEEQKLIHSQDPKRKTSGEVLGTTYFYHDLRLMARYAKLLGLTEDARQYEERAASMKEAFNAKYLDRARHLYDNGSHTSSVLPLAFGMVPDDERQAVFEHLTNKIEKETGGHIGTGLIGGQWLMRALTAQGRADLALGIATKTEYPSWGYMLEQGATTIWELWNGNTADPAMNSGNHVMLVGDLVIWLYENIAGIAPDSEQPGYAHILMRPVAVEGLDHIAASLKTQRGPVRSEWRKDKGVFTWNVSIPANTTATVCVPAANVTAVSEGGHPATQARGLKFLRMDNGAAIFEAGSGRYHFEVGK